MLAQALHHPLYPGEENPMAMRPCSHCLENRWKYELTEGIVTATCQSCGREVSFAARKKTNGDRPQTRGPIASATPYMPWVPEGYRDPNLLPWE